MNPYETLGVATTATLDEIKKAYRKLAKKYHPDINPGNKDSEKKFKEISHAFDLIGTAEERGKYDRGETEDQQRAKYEEQMKNAGNQRFYRDTQGPHSRYSQSFENDPDMEDIFSQFFGGAGKRDRGPQVEQYQMEVDFKEAAIGGDKVITIPSGKNLQVKIPAGIEEGKKLKFKGMGKNGNDVLIEIKIKPDSHYKRSGTDILSEVEISFFEAAVGGEISVPTLDGNVLLKVPAGVSTGSKLRIKGKGVGSGDSRGNQIVTLKVVMPKTINPDLQASLKDLSQKYGYDPRRVV